MFAGYLASDNRYFFEHELAPMLRTRTYATKIGQACARSFGSGDRTFVSFAGKHGQEHLLQVLNSDVRYLRDRSIDQRAVAELLCVAHKSLEFDKYELKLESARLTYAIIEYQLLSGEKRLRIDPLRDYRVENFPLIRVVELSVCPVVLLPRA